MHNICLEKWQFDLIIDALILVNEKKCSKQVTKTINEIKGQVNLARTRKNKPEQVDPFNPVSNDPINW